jgi:hypothetical protein
VTAAGLPWPCGPHPFRPLTFHGPGPAQWSTTDWCGHLPGGLDAVRSGAVAGVCGQLAEHPVHRPVGAVPLCPPSSFVCRCLEPAHGWRIARCVWSAEHGSRPRPVSPAVGGAAYGGRHE